MIQLVGTLLTITWPLWLTFCALRVLQNGPDRDLVLPTPYMMLVAVRAHQGTVVSVFVLMASSVAVLVLLYGCRQQTRTLARWATIACGVAALYMQLNAAWLARSSTAPSSLPSTRL